MTNVELKAARLRLGWSQVDAAARFGMSHRAYRYLEEGVNAHGKPLPFAPTTVAITMLAFALAADIEEEGSVSQERLVEFRQSVDREANPSTEK